jgi:hypothetical protein
MRVVNEFVRRWTHRSLFRPESQIRCATTDQTTFGLRLAGKGALTSRRLAEELDGSVSYKYSKNVTFGAGASYVAAGDGIKTLGRLGDNMTWAYLMTHVAF